MLEHQAPVCQLFRLHLLVYHCSHSHVDEVPQSFDLDLISDGVGTGVVLILHMVPRVDDQSIPFQISVYSR